MAKKSESHAIRFTASDHKLIQSIRKEWEPIIGPMNIPQVIRMALLYLEGKK